MTPSGPSSSSTATSETAFWLDSSKVDERARFSFMGAAGGPLSAAIHYDVASGELRIERAGGEIELLQESIFDYLSREMRRAAPPLRTTCRSTSTAASSATSATS